VIISAGRTKGSPGQLRATSVAGTAEFQPQRYLRAPRVTRAAAERGAALRLGERLPAGFVRHGAAGGVLDDAAPGGLGDPPVWGGAAALDVSAQQPDEVGRDGDGAVLVGGAVLQAATIRETLDPGDDILMPP
jgi:hypothetical protein